MAQYMFGTGQLFASNVGGGSPLRIGALQDVSVEFSGDVKQLFGQYQYALAVARGKTKIEGKFGTGNIDVAAFNALFFQTSGGVVTGQKKQAVNEAGAVPAVVAPSTSTVLTQAAGVATATFAAAHGFAVGEVITVTGATAAGYNVANTPILSVPSPTTLTYAVPSATTSPATVQGTFTGSYKVVVANGATMFRDLGVTDVLTALAMKQVPSGPATGQYSVNIVTGEYTFAAADAGKALLFNYIYTDAANGGTMNIDNQLMGLAPRLELIASQTFQNKVMTLCLYSITVDKLSLPLKQDDFTISESSYQAQANDANQIGFLSTTSTAGGGA